MTPRQTALSALVYEYSHARACEAAFRVRAIRDTDPAEVDKHRAASRHWTEAARTAARELKATYGLELPGADIALT